MKLLIPIPFGIIASFMDIKTGKIKNFITYPLLALGIFINSYLNGFEGLRASLIGVFYIIFLVSIKSIFKLGGGDLKLAMGYGAFLTDDKILTFIPIFLILIMIRNITYYIFKKGLKSLLLEMKYEIKSFGAYKTEFDKLVGGPLLFTAYILTLLIYYFY